MSWIPSRDQSRASRQIFLQNSIPGKLSEYFSMRSECQKSSVSREVTLGRTRNCSGVYTFSSSTVNALSNAFCFFWSFSFLRASIASNFARASASI